MSKIKGSEYKELVKRVFVESKSAGTGIKSKFKNEVDPIVQNNTKFDIKRPQMSKTSIDYIDYASPKKERLHKKVNFQKSTIFTENQEATQPRPQKRQVELYIEETEPKPRKKKIHSPTSNNPITCDGEQNGGITRKAKNNRSRPGDNDGLLQLPEQKEKYSVQEEHYNPSINSSQLFSEGNRKKSSNINLNNAKQYRFDKYSSYKTDHVTDIFNSKINERTPEQKITPKPNADNYSAFVKEARGICYERYHDYY